MNIDIIAPGKIKEKYFKDALEEYSKRLSAFVRLTITEIPDERIPDGASEKQLEKIKETEGEKILSKIRGGAVVAMCIEGREYSSEELAGFLEKTAASSSRITFIIGGSLGLSEAVKNRADIRMSFGRITLPHQLMRVVLTEQIYRGYKIINNHSYHK
ncbi:MAG: 23S rRNA (pseudouridine(1915)-N(3))-methyltransferase RlmH [Clostridia bacterium]|nr:23S rRNA (pseudouridine(1915)-N(3))-methyltransferase RlmH [Clostridia bacterium]